MDTVPRPALVAHRGYAQRYPENTLLGVEAALRAGAPWLEIDVQLTADGCPVLFHDAELKRTTGVRGLITERRLSDLAALRAAEPARFGARFQDEAIPTLAAFAALLGRWPAAAAFVEIKEESLERCGAAAVVGAVVAALGPVLARCVVISYDKAALMRARRDGAPAIGWILRAYDGAARMQARRLAPEYLICNYTKLPATGRPLWRGPWHWVVYEVTAAPLARALARRGVEFVETMAVEDLSAGLDAEAADDR